MKKLTGLIILAVLAVMLSGCVINVGEQDYVFKNNCVFSTVHVTYISNVASGEPTSFDLAPFGKKVVRMRSSSFTVNYLDNSIIDMDVDQFSQTVTFSGGSLIP